MGDMPTPNLEKRPSFHTQTLTQLLGDRAPEMEDRAALRVEDEAESAGLLPSRRGPPAKGKGEGKGKGKGLATHMLPHTPTGKRIKVNPDEVPSSQPTPFTPLFGHSPIPPTRSPLAQKSTNVDAAPPTIETVSKRPRSLVIQDSYSSAAGDTPVKRERGETPSQIPKREPLAEIPVASLELGVSSAPSGDTPTRRRGKRLFTEIPDSDDELESLGSTPLKARSTQQTPLKRESVADNFEIAADPSTPQPSRGPSAAVAETPASSSRSDKENESPAIKMWEDEDAAGEDDGGSPTPRGGKRSQAAHGGSQVSPNTASQFWTASAENAGSLGNRRGTSREPLAELVAAEDPTIIRSQRQSPALRTPLFHGSMGESSRRGGRQATPQLGDSEETASEAEGEPMPVSILRKAASQDTRKRGTTPELSTSESSAAEPPDTPTPVGRRVQIEIPRSPGGKAHWKTSPLHQRHTQARSQARSQFYSQAWESQRVPLEVIRSLGPQTDRSDILISVDAKTVEEIADGLRDHVFRDYRFPVQVSRCWIFTELPVGEVKYMATLGPAQEPGQIDSHSGRGNAEFNQATPGSRFAHKLLQVYQLNNPVPLAEMEDNGLGAEPPQRYRYVPPAIVGQLLMNLRCALFAEGDPGEEEVDEGAEDKEATGEGEEEEGEMTISQELEDQLRRDIIHSTQLNSSERRRQQRRGDDGCLVSASQSPAEQRADALKAAAPAAPPRSSQRRQPAPAGRASTSNDHNDDDDDDDDENAAGARRYVRPSQATTASDVSASSPTQAPPSAPRRPELPRHDHDRGPSGRSRSGTGDTGILLHLSSSQVGVLPPDSLLADEEEGRAPPPPVEVWDSEDEE
ncbi:hypothetical protein VTH06DRAFT_7702 [Thermothelomyces fergusii]